MAGSPRFTPQGIHGQNLARGEAGRELRELPQQPWDRRDRRRLPQRDGQGMLQLPPQAGRNLHEELSRQGDRAGGKRGGGLLELPRRARHPAQGRPAFARGAGQPGGDLRALPPERQQEFHQIPAPRRLQRPQKQHAGLRRLDRDERLAAGDAFRLHSAYVPLVPADPRGAHPSPARLSPASPARAAHHALRAGSPPSLTRWSSSVSWDW